jgi:hypothetical protein
MSDAEQLFARESARLDVSLTRRLGEGHAVDDRGRILSIHD